MQFFLGEIKDKEKLFFKAKEKKDFPFALME